MAQFQSFNMTWVSQSSKIFQPTNVVFFGTRMRALWLFSRIPLRFVIPAASKEMLHTLPPRLQAHRVPCALQLKLLPHQACRALPTHWLHPLHHRCLPLLPHHWHLLLSLLSFPKQSVQHQQRPCIAKWTTTPDVKFGWNPRYRSCSSFGNRFLQRRKRPPDSGPNVWALQL